MFNAEDSSTESARIPLDSSVEIGVMPLTERVCIELSVHGAGQS